MTGDRIFNRVSSVHIASRWLDAYWISISIRHFTQVSRIHECAHISTNFNPKASNSPLFAAICVRKCKQKWQKGSEYPIWCLQKGLKTTSCARVEPDPSNAALLQIEATSVRMQQSVKGQLKEIYILHSISFFFTLDGHTSSLWMHLLFLAKQAIASSYLAASPQWARRKKNKEGKRCLLCESCKLCMMIGFHDNWQLAQCCTSIFLGNVISHAGCCCNRRGFENWINKCHPCCIERSSRAEPSSAWKMVDVIITQPFFPT